MTNRQEVFDTVCEHMISQGKRCATPDMCLYRGTQRKNSKLKCAVGILIKNEHYTKDIEEKGVVTKEVQEVLKKSLPDFRLNETNITFLKELQHIHDDVAPAFWADALRKHAREYKLKQPNCIKEAA